MICQHRAFWHCCGSFVSFASMCGSKDPPPYIEGIELKKKQVLEGIQMGRGGFRGLVRGWKGEKWGMTSSYANC